MVFRSQKGKVHIVDAYCPHLGANMGVGARVFGDCLECPFHGWKFNGETGICTDIPYASKGKVQSLFLSRIRFFSLLAN